MSLVDRPTESPAAPDHYFLPNVLVMVSCSLILGQTFSVESRAEQRRDPHMLQTEDAKSVLVGITLGNPSLAIIGEEVVTRGDCIEGWIVQEIQADEVVLQQSEGSRKVVHLSELIPPAGEGEICPGAAVDLLLKNPPITSP